MDALSSGKVAKGTLAFENNMFGIITNVSKENRRSYMAALDFDDEKTNTERNT